MDHSNTFDDAAEYITDLGLPINELNMAIATVLATLTDGYLYEFWCDELNDPSAWTEVNLRDLESDVVMACAA